MSLTLVARSLVIVLPIALFLLVSLSTRADGDDKSIADASSQPEVLPVLQIDQSPDLAKEPTTRNEGTAIPTRPRDPADLDADLRILISRKNPPDWAILASEEIPVFLADNTLLTVGKDRSHFEILNPADGKTNRSVPAIEKPISRMRLTPDRRWLAHQASVPGQPSFFPRSSTFIVVRELPFCKITGMRIDVKQFGHEDYEIAPDGKTVVTGGEDGVHLWDVQTGKNLKEILTKPIRADAIAFSPDGRWLVVSSQNTLTYAKWKTAELPVIVEAGRLITSLTFTPDSRFLVEGPVSREDIEVRDMETMQVIRRLKDETGHSMSLNNMQLTDQGKTLVAGNDCGYDWRKVIVKDRLHFWDLQTGTIVRKLDFSRHEVFGVAVSPDGRYLVAAIHDLGDVLLAGWDLSKLGRVESR